MQFVVEPTDVWRSRQFRRRNPQLVSNRRPSCQLSRLQFLVKQSTIRSQILLVVLTV